MYLFLAQGKVELELEVVTEEEELVRPAGKAREEPNRNPHLPEPERPAGKACKEPTREHE